MGQSQGVETTPAVAFLGLLNPMQSPQVLVAEAVLIVQKAVEERKPTQGRVTDLLLVKAVLVSVKESFPVGRRKHGEVNLVEAVLPEDQP